MKHLDGLLKMVRDIEKGTEIARSIGRSHEKQFQALAELTKRFVDGRTEAIEEAQGVFRRFGDQMSSVIEQHRRVWETMNTGIDLSKLTAGIQIPDISAQLKMDFSPRVALWNERWFNYHLSHDDIADDPENERLAGFVQSPSVNRRKKPRVNGFGK